MSDEIDGELLPLGVSELADAIRAAIGAGPFDPVRVYAPPHRSRGDGIVVRWMPSVAEFKLLSSLERGRLIRLGLRPWDESGLLLFPVEWYDLIPDGFEIVTISGEREAFRRGVTDNDCRFGVLAYGIIAEEPPC